MSRPPAARALGLDVGNGMVPPADHELFVEGVDEGVVLLAVENAAAREVVEETVGTNGASDTDVEHPDFLSGQDEAAANDVKVDATDDIRLAGLVVRHH